MNTGGSYLLNDNLRGMIISQRPAELEALRFSKTNPFVSRVTIKDPLGLPPIKKSVVFRPQRKFYNYVDMKNREIIKRIQNLKKIEKDLIHDEEIMKKNKQDKIRDRMLKQNFNINEIRKELYGYNVNFNSNDKDRNNFESEPFEKEKILGTNFLNLNTKYHNTKIKKLKEENSENYNNYVDTEIVKKPTLEEINQILPIIPNKPSSLLAIEDDDEGNLNKLLSFVNNLDYQKYVNDLEIREALYLIKNKVEKDKIEEVENLNNLNNLNNNLENNDENKNDHTSLDKNSENVNNNKFSNLGPIIHEKEWDSSVKPVEENLTNEEQIAKQQIAQKILKADKQLRTIHSYNSVKKLLEREGFISPNKLSTLKIAILKEKEGIQDFEHKVSLMPNLRDIPII